MTADLMRIASGIQFAREHRLQHEDAEATGADYETLAERIERHDRERNAHAAEMAAELEDAAQGCWDAEDRRWREAHPVAPSEDAIKSAVAYMDRVAREGLL